MKTIKTKFIIIEYVEPETDEEYNEMKKIIKEVEEDTFNKNLNRYKLEVPENLKKKKKIHIK